MRLATAVALGVVMTAICGVGAARAQTSDPDRPAGARESTEALIARHIAARGGHDVLAAVRAVRMEGTLEVRAGLQSVSGPIVLEVLPREHKARLETTLDGARTVTVYDGTRAWRTSNGGGPAMGTAEELHGEALATIARTAELGGLLFDASAHGRTVEDLGPATVHGRPAEALRVTDPVHGAWKLFLAADTGLEIAEQRLGSDGASVAAQTELLDFRRQNGLVLPYAVESAVLTAGPGGTAAVWTEAIWQRVELDGTIPAGDFAEPSAD